MDPSLLIAGEFEGSSSVHHTHQRQRVLSTVLQSALEDQRREENIQLGRRDSVSLTAAAAPDVLADAHHFAATAVGGDEDDEGFAMPSLVPGYASSSVPAKASAGGSGRGILRLSSMNKHGKSSNTDEGAVGGSAIEERSKAFESHQRAMGLPTLTPPLAHLHHPHDANETSHHNPRKAVADEAAVRRKEREDFLADYEAALYSKYLSRCVRCRCVLVADASSTIVEGGTAGLVAVDDSGAGAAPLPLSEDVREAMARRYMSEARRRIKASHARTPMASIAPSIPGPQVWCAGCIVYAGAAAAPTTSSSPANSNLAHVSPLVCHQQCPLCPAPPQQQQQHVDAKRLASRGLLLSTTPFDLTVSSMGIYKPFSTHAAQLQQQTPQLRQQLATVQPMLKCQQCKLSFHGHCLKLDAELLLALSAADAPFAYCCPSCTLATAVLAGSAGAAAPASTAAVKSATAANDSDDDDHLKRRTRKQAGGVGLGKKRGRK